MAAADENADAIGGGIEQEVWRAAHIAGGKAGLDAGSMGRLRSWTADRLRNQTFAVLDQSEGDVILRRSFHDALRHAARCLAEGHEPD